ncbi:hypothetical protein PINS_up010573 [Pythium insidiosum]|nr:hypothetical protein PINS_up010573 [Pythium insidiosum]
MSLSSDVLDRLAFHCEFGVFGDGEQSNDESLFVSNAKHAMRYADALGFLTRRDFGNVVRFVTTQIESDRHNRRDAVLFLLRARARFELQEFAETIKDAERVIALLPTATEGFVWLAKAFIALQEPHNARRVCHEGLAVAPANETLLTLRDSLPKSKTREQSAVASKRQRYPIATPSHGTTVRRPSPKTPCLRCYATLRKSSRSLRKTQSFSVAVRVYVSS